MQRWDWGTPGFRWACDWCNRRGQWVTKKEQATFLGEKHENRRHADVIERYRQMLAVQDAALPEPPKPRVRSGRQGSGFRV